MRYFLRKSHANQKVSLAFCIIVHKYKILTAYKSVCTDYRITRKPLGEAALNSNHPTEYPQRNQQIRVDYTYVLCEL